MSGKYGFSGGIDLPKTTPAPKPRPKIDGSSLSEAVKAGADLGFVSREPTTRLKPGPKRKEPQGKVSIPGPNGSWMTSGPSARPAILPCGRVWSCCSKNRRAGTARAYRASQRLCDKTQETPY